MKPTTAVVVLAALAPCILTIERITAAPLVEPNQASATTECEKGCEKSCCSEKTACTEKSCCSEKAASAETAVSADSAAAASCCDGKCEHSATAQALRISEYRIGLPHDLTIFVPTLQPTALSAAVIPQPGTSTVCATSACATSACADAAGPKSACAGSLHAALPGPGTYQVIVPPTVRYSAIPAAVPSPFAKDADVANTSAQVIATQAYAATLPLQQPPAPVAQASADLVAPDPVPCPHCVAPAAASAPQAEKATQVLFNVDVIEDSSGSLSEFDSLQGDMPFFTADSEIMLATLRILEKQNLLRRISDPRLVTTVGRTGVLQVGTESPGDDGTAATFNGIRMEVAAREYGGGLEIQFKYRDTAGRNVFGVSTTMLLSHGQTVVMKTSSPLPSSPLGRAENDAEKRDARAVYVVLTPQVIK